MSATVNYGHVVGPTGPQGATGPEGAQGWMGTTAYQTAANAGYAHGESQFSAQLAAISLMTNGTPGYVMKMTANGAAWVSQG